MSKRRVHLGPSRDAIETLTTRINFVLCCRVLYFENAYPLTEFDSADKTIFIYQLFSHQDLYTCYDFQTLKIQNVFSILTTFVCNMKSYKIYNG